jgi:hypothetical protein
MANNNTQKALLGAGLAMAAAGAYFFLGPNGKKHQKKMRGWMVRMRGEVLERLEDAREVTQPVYNEIIDAVADTYVVANKVPKDEIMTLAGDLKKHWKAITNPKKRKPAPKTTRRPKK